MSDLTTYGALSCELAFLQSFAICFTLVDQSGERIALMSMTILLIHNTLCLQLNKTFSDTNIRNLEEL